MSRHLKLGRDKKSGRVSVSRTSNGTFGRPHSLPAEAFHRRKTSSVLPWSKGCGAIDWFTTM